MADIPKSFVFTPLDEKRLTRVRRVMEKYYGKVSFSFIMREALRILEETLGESK